MLEINPLEGSFGVEVRGVDLDRLDAAGFDAVLCAWQAHPLVLFRRQVIGEGALVEFSRRFGELERFDRPEIYRPPHPEVLYVSNLLIEDGTRLGSLGSSELDWHTDQSYRERPATGAVFQALLVPEGDAGATAWCNTEMAHAALAPARQGEIEHLRTVSRYNGYLRENLDAAARQALAARYPPVEHPLVLVQPGSGRRCLYLDISTTYGLAGVDADRAEALLAELARHMTRPQFVYSHCWQAGDVMLWDNARLCHRRDAINPHTPRLARRTSIFMDPARFAVPAP